MIFWVNFGFGGTQAWNGFADERKYRVSVTVVQYMCSNVKLVNEKRDKKKRKKKETKTYFFRLFPKGRVILKIRFHFVEN